MTAPRLVAVSPDPEPLHHQARCQTCGGLGEILDCQRPGQCSHTNDQQWPCPDCTDTGVDALVDEWLGKRVRTPEHGTGQVIRVLPVEYDRPAALVTLHRDPYDRVVLPLDELEPIPAGASC